LTFLAYTTFQHTRRIDQSHADSHNFFSPAFSEADFVVLKRTSRVSRKQKNMITDCVVEKHRQSQFLRKKRTEKIESCLMRMWSE
jgi:hypothetical protein